MAKPRPTTATKLQFYPNDPSLNRNEPDSQAINVDLVDPATLPPPPPDIEEPNYSGAPPNSGAYDPTKPTYYVDGIKVTERFALNLLHIGSAGLDPKYVHDVSTLNRAGITGHWEKKPVARANTSDPTGISFFAGNGYDVVSSFVVDRVGQGNGYLFAAFQQPQRPQRRGERERPQQPQPLRQINCENLLLVPLDDNARYTQLNNGHVVALFHPNYATALSTAIRELNRAGIVPQINSGYRTEAEQQRMRDGAAGRNPAAQNTSIHQTGYAVDINGVGGRNGANILTAMAARGMTRVNNDPPHFEINAFGPRGDRGTEQRQRWRERVRQAAVDAELYYNQCIMGQAVTIR